MLNKLISPYSNEAMAVATYILQNDNKFVKAEAEFDAEQSYESAAREQPQRVANMTRNMKGMAAERDEEKT